MENTKTSFIQGLLFLVLAQTMVGLNIVVSKSLVSTMPVFFLLAVRFSLATLMLTLLHCISPARKHSPGYYFSQLESKDWIYIILQALSAGVLFNFFMLFGLNYTDANVAGIITSALPAMIALMSWLLLKEKFSAKKSLCVVFASIGLLIIALDKVQGGSLHTAKGDLLIFLSLLPESLYYILCKLRPNKLPVFFISALLNGINAIILLILIYFFPWQGALEWRDALILLVLGVSSGFFYVFWFFGCQRVDGIMASLSTAVMPVTTVIFAWILLGENLSIAEATGMGLVIFSIIFYAR